MHAGFGFYEAGMCRAKNTVDTLSHNLMILAVTVVVYWLAGFALMFGEGNGWIGWAGFAPRLLGGIDGYPGLAPRVVPVAVAFAFCLSFADTPATLIAGTGAERIRFAAVMTLTVLISGVIFPVVGRWTIGGGWMMTLATPLYDTGSGSIQFCGGCCALAVSLRLGPRTEAARAKGRADRRGGPDEPSSMPLIFLGAFILWLGFLGFNAGFSMVAAKSAGLVIVNTTLGGCSGAVAGMAGSWLLTGKLHLRTAIVALLTANVAVTSPSAVVEPWAAALIGAVAGLVTAAGLPARVRLGLDDPTEYLVMNLAGGLIGLASVGLFASPGLVADYPITPKPAAGLFYGGGWAQLLVQLSAAVAIAAFVLPGIWLAASALHRFGLLRVDAEEERQGSDLASHDERAYGER